MAKKTTKTAKTDVSGTNSGEENILKWLKDHPRIEVSAEAEETEAPAKATKSEGCRQENDRQDREG